jgi:hypothetical protein
MSEAMGRFVSLFKERNEATKREAEKRRADEKKRKAEKPSWHIENWNWTAIATCVMAAFTVGIYFVGRYQWHTFQDQLAVMQDQLNAMEADQRPWMKIEKIAPSISPIDPRFGGLRFNGPNTIGFLPLDILVKNVGHSPALDVRVGIGQFYGYAQKEIDLAKAEHDQCYALDNAFPQTPLMVDSTTFIRVIFPGEDSPYNSIALGILPDQVAKYSTGDNEQNKVFQLWFYGCIRYTFANSKAPHQTSFAYRVSHLVDASIPGGKAMDVSFKPWEDIPGERILLESRPMTAGVTN